jgi:hypothetical protein
MRIRYSIAIQEGSGQPWRSFAEGIGRLSEARKQARSVVRNGYIGSKARIVASMPGDDYTVAVFIRGDNGRVQEMSP